MNIEEIIKAKDILLGILLSNEELTNFIKDPLTGKVSILDCAPTEDMVNSVAYRGLAVLADTALDAMDYNTGKSVLRVNFVIYTITKIPANSSALQIANLCVKAIEKFNETNETKFNVTSMSHVMLTDKHCAYRINFNTELK